MHRYRLNLFVSLPSAGIAAAMLLAAGCEPPAPVDDRPVFVSFQETAELRGLTVPLDDPQDYEGIAPQGTGGRIIARDLDADGDVDLLIVRFVESPLIYRNDGGGSFELIAPTFTLPVEHAPWMTAAAADLDGDGLPELLLAGRSAVMRLDALGDLAWDQPTQLVARSPVEKREFSELGLGDADGDGDVDLLLVTDDAWGTSQLLLLNQGDALREPLAVDLPVAQTALVGIFTDMERDQNLELLIPVTGNRGAPALYHLTGAPTEPEGWENRATAGGLPGDMDAMGIDTADLDGDGLLDYVISDIGPPKVLLSDGGSALLEAGLSLGLHDGEVGWSVDLADFDADGFLDLVQASGPVRTGQGTEGTTNMRDLLWMGSADGFEEKGEELGFGDPSHHLGLVTADFDGDGDLDILAAGAGDVPVLYENGGNSRPLLVVHLDGTPGNRDGFGAVVEVEAGASTQVRMQHGPRGPAQGPVTLSFGLGEATGADRVRVFWPDGAITEMLDVPAGVQWRARHPEAAE